MLIASLQRLLYEEKPEMSNILHHYSSPIGICHPLPVSDVVDPRGGPASRKDRS